MAQPDPDSEAETITIHELLERSAESALELQRKDGSFPPGRNYAYDEPETPVRTTSHWTMTLSKVYDITGKDKFKEAADAAVDYLLNHKVRPHGFTYFCRDATGKDHCNGLVGQAGAIRALAHAGPILGRQDAIDTAEEVFAIHPFNEDLGLWERVEIDGRKLSFDRTLNHQILFAEGSCHLAAQSNLIAEQIGMFLDHLESNMRIHSNGLIKHYIGPPLSSVLPTIAKTPRYYDLIINEVMSACYSFSSKRRQKERGYQVVNLVGLSKLYQSFPDHPLWDSNSLAQTLRFVKINQEELVRRENIRHGTQLQSIAIAKIRSRFGGVQMSGYANLIAHDLQFNPDSKALLDIEGVDPNTRSAMVVALVDLPDLRISTK